MADVNTVVLVGNLTRDIEVRYSNNGVAIGKSSIAINRRRKNGDQWIDEASFFDFTILGKSAEGLRPYLVRGKQVAIQGSLVQDRWEKDGQKFSRVYVLAENIQLCGGNRGSGSSGYNQSASQGNSYGGGYQNAPQQNYPQNQGNASSFQNNDVGGFPEDIPYTDDGMDIPF